MIELRRQGLSVYEISARLAAEGTPLNRTSVGEILAEEGFGRLLRHPEPEASISPSTAGRDTNLPRAKVLDFESWPERLDSVRAGLLLVLPDLVALDLPALVGAAGYPSTSVVPATSWLLSLLGLKLTRTRRVSHVDDLLADPAPALLAGMAVLPKKSALTDYSYRLSYHHQRAFLSALDKTMISSGLATSDEAIFDLDFHAVMHWGKDPVLKKHYVPKRSQRARSVLTFFAQDSGTHNLVYANADLSKATQSREVIAFCDHWRELSGHDPHMVIMDQKVTTHTVLGELDARGVKFLTLRMRSPSLVSYINNLGPADYRSVTLDRPGPYNHPKVHEDIDVRLTAYPKRVRQLVVTGLGRDAPTVIVTNDTEARVKALIEHYARRMTIEQRLAEIIRAFCADALSSTVNLNVDLDACSACSPRRSRPRCAPGCPGTPMPRPTPSSAGSSRPPARSSPPATPSPSASNAAPTHRCCDRPTCPPKPRSRGGEAGPCASSSPERCAESPVWKWALMAGERRQLISRFPYRSPAPRRITVFGAGKRTGRPSTWENGFAL